MGIRGAYRGGPELPGCPEEPHIARTAPSGIEAGPSNVEGFGGVKEGRAAARKGQIEGPTRAFTRPPHPYTRAELYRRRTTTYHGNERPRRLPNMRLPTPAAREG